MKNRDADDGNKERGESIPSIKRDAAAMAQVSKYPSVITMPAVSPPWPLILDFLCQTFPHVVRAQWLERIATGRVLDDHGNPITMQTSYTPSKRLYYFREIGNEPVIPFPEQILYQDDEILVACKPHWLPVTPGGRYVNECLLNRLRHSTGMDDLAPMHRLDRETAGLVLLSVNKRTRGHYHALFAHGQVEKTYHALAELRHPPREREWLVENRIVRGEPRFIMTTTPGSANARSRIRLLEVRDGQARFSLNPLTGKTHQLRLHMSGLGFPIVNDRYYPTLQPVQEVNFDQPLQLIASTLQFHDPITGTDRQFISPRKLLW